jgi:hypothetical protein
VFPLPVEAPVTLLILAVVQLNEAPAGLLVNDIFVEVPEQEVCEVEVVTEGVGRITEERVA